MPTIYGPKEWDHKVESCAKHGIPTLPCPACLAEQNPSIQVMLTKEDRIVLDWDPDVTVADLMPAGHPWLLERLV